MDHRKVFNVYEVIRLSLVSVISQHKGSCLALGPSLTNLMNPDFLVCHYRFYF